MGALVSILIQLYALNAWTAEIGATTLKLQFKDLKHELLNEIKYDSKNLTIGKHTTIESYPLRKCHKELLGHYLENRDKLVRNCSPIEADSLLFVEIIADHNSLKKSYKICRQKEASVSKLTLALQKCK